MRDGLGLSSLTGRFELIHCPEKLNIFFYFRNLFPDNLFAATFRKSQTKTKPMDMMNSTNTTVEEAAAVEVKKYVASVDGTNLLGENSIYILIRFSSIMWIFQ